MVLLNKVQAMMSKKNVYVYAIFAECVSHEYIISIILNTLRPGQNGRHFADDIFKCIFLNENVWTPIKISLKFVPKGRINNIPALVQIMAWRRPGDKPLSEPMMVSLPTHICVTRPQWVKSYVCCHPTNTDDRNKRASLTYHTLLGQFYVRIISLDNVIWLATRK